MSAWLPLSEKERNEVWDKFYDKFSFRPSVHKEQWPGIREPVPSLTYSIAGAFTGEETAFRILESDLHTKALSIFQQLVPPEGRLYALDWQHPGFWLYPHKEFTANESDTWSVPALPNGDYYIFLAEDFSFGWFGHPWEQTICVFGEPLLQTLEQFRPRLFTTPLRRNGRTS